MSHAAAAPRPGLRRGLSLSVLLGLVASLVALVAAPAAPAAAVPGGPTFTAVLQWNVIGSGSPVLAAQDYLPGLFATTNKTHNHQVTLGEDGPTTTVLLPPAEIGGTWTGLLQAFPNTPAPAGHRFGAFLGVRGLRVEVTPTALIVKGSVFSRPPCADAALDCNLPPLDGVQMVDGVDLPSYYNLAPADYSVQAYEVTNVTLFTRSLEDDVEMTVSEDCDEDSPRTTWKPKDTPAPAFHWDRAFPSALLDMGTLAHFLDVNEELPAPASDFTFTIVDKEGCEAGPGDPPHVPVVVLPPVPAPPTTVPAVVRGLCDFAAPEEGRYGDVSADNLHAGAIECMSRLGVTQGQGDGSFQPRAGARREQVATALVRLLAVAGIDLPDPGASSFGDIDQSAHAVAIRKLQAAGILLGKGDGTFDASSPMTRAQFALVLSRIAKLVLGSDLPDGQVAFPDASGHAHAKAIGQLFRLGVAKGSASGLFRPDDPVRRDEMDTFLARLYNLLLT